MPVLKLKYNFNMTPRLLCEHSQKFSAGRDFARKKLKVRIPHQTNDLLESISQKAFKREKPTILFSKFL